ncbi:MAG: hypothetical protein ACTSUE_22275, partial [Promethearchaeota archaeon]
MNRLVELEELGTKTLLINKKEYKALTQRENNILKVISAVSSEHENLLEITIKCRHYLGLVRISESLSFIIKPKFDSADFMAMLEYIDSERIQLLNDLIQGINRDKNFIELFINSFLEKTFKFLT